MLPRPAKRRLRLESLEVRALLAGDVGSDLARAMAAVQGSAPIDGSLDPRTSNHLLELSGQGTEAVIIDLDRLPSFVTRISLSNFASVTMSGTDKVDYLIASDVESLFAPNLSINAGVYLNNVGAVDLASGGPLALLSGKSTDFSVRSLDQTTVYSYLETLTIQSDSKVLNVENWHPNPTIQLKGRPESITVAGIDSAAAVRLLDAGTTAVSRPITDVPGNEIPPSTGPESEQPGTSVVVIKLDQRTFAFIAEFRESLKTSSKDSQRVLLDFLSQSATEASTAAATMAKPGRTLVHATPRDLEVALQRAPIAAGAEWQGAIASVAAGESAPLSALVFDYHTDQPIDLSAATLQLPVEPGPRIEIDATWPVAVVATQPSENPEPFTPLGLGQPEPVEPRLEDSIRAFTDYVVDRVTAEFSPGEQSLVLLVDPKPNRPGSVNHGSTLELFGSATRTSLAGLRQVMS